jgi:hypothetical protein
VRGKGLLGARYRLIGVRPSGAYSGHRRVLLFGPGHWSSAIYQFQCHGGDLDRSLQPCAFRFVVSSRSQLLSGKLNRRVPDACRSYNGNIA